MTGSHLLPVQLLNDSDYIFCTLQVLMNKLELGRVFILYFMGNGYTPGEASLEKCFASLLKRGLLKNDRFCFLFAFSFNQVHCEKGSPCGSKSFLLE